MCKYIFISGGVVSGCGKGISAASLGLLLKQRGERVQIIKFDPYLNVSASTLSPYQHGETWVCDDGSETDLDLGHYERIVGIDVSSRNICTSGTLFAQVSEEERDGKYLGDTIQIHPHITSKIQNILIDLGKDADIVIAEIGGTVGDFESGHFYTAIQQFKQKLGSDNVLLIHVAPILWLKTIGEFKTKPFQQSVTELRRGSTRSRRSTLRCTPHSLSSATAWRCAATGMGTAFASWLSALLTSTMCPTRCMGCGCGGMAPCAAS